VLRGRVAVIDDFGGATESGLLRGSVALRNPSNIGVAEALNLRPLPAPEHVCDTVVVGAGPAGLAAAVYAACEGLDTVLLDSVAIGTRAPPRGSRTDVRTAHRPPSSVGTAPPVRRPCSSHDTSVAWSCSCAATT
jgi:hypothetical protein